MASAKGHTVAAISLFLGLWSSAAAQQPVAMPIEREFDAIQARYAETSEATRSPAVQQVAYTPAGSPTAPTAPTTVIAPPVITPANGPTIYPSPDGATVAVVQSPSDAWCIPPQPPGRTSSWTAAIEVIASDPRITDGQFGEWTDDGTTAWRVLLGYEDPRGIGTRIRYWGLSQESETYINEDVELNVSKFDLDLYKRFFPDGGEFAVGAGPSSGRLEFDIESLGKSRFRGAGGTVFVDGYYGLMYFNKSELGAVGRARYSLLLGDWRDETGGIIVPETDNDTMGVTELAWGLEFRRRFGPCEDHSWFLGVLAEYQRWQSDWMSNLAGTSVGVSGVNVYTGLNW